MHQSGTQKYVWLSVTNAEVSMGVTCAQDILFVMQVLQLFELK